MIGIYIVGGISGGHLNPAITISMSVWRGFPARRCVIYILAQLIGAITAGGIAYAIYHDAIVNLSVESNLPQSETTASQAFLTLPKQFVSPATAFFNEFLGTAILVGTIMALGDDTNAPPGAGMQAFIIGILITVLVLALGYNTGGYVHPSSPHHITIQLMNIQRIQRSPRLRPPSRRRNGRLGRTSLQRVPRLVDLGPLGRRHLRRIIRRVHLRLSCVHRRRKPDQLPAEETEARSADQGEESAE